MSSREHLVAFASSADVHVVCTDAGSSESVTCSLLSIVFNRAAEHVIKYAHPGLFDASACSHPPCTAVICATRATEAVIVVPSTLRSQVTAALRAVDQAACRQEVRFSDRHSLLPGAESAAAARCAWHFREALEHLHIVFVSSIREAVACLSALHSGSTLSSEIARSSALLEGSVRGIARSLSAAGPASSVVAAAGAGGLLPGERMGVDECDDASHATGASAGAGASSSDPAGGAACAVDSDGVAPVAPRHFWLQLSVLGNTIDAGPAVRSSSSAAGRSAGAGAGSSAGASSAATAAVRSSATATLAAAPTFIAIHALDQLMLEHYEETMRKRRADGSLASHPAEAAAATAAASAAAARAEGVPAALPAPISSAPSAAHHDSAMMPDAARSSGAVSAALANPFALSAAARLLAVASSALSQTDAIWNELDSAAVVALDPLNTPTAASAVGSRMPSVHISLPRPKSSLLLSLGSQDALKCRVTDDRSGHSGVPSLSAPRAMSMATTGLGQLLARLRADITIIRSL